MNAHNEQHDPASAVVKQNLTTRPAAAPGIDPDAVERLRNLAAYAGAAGCPSMGGDIKALLDALDASPKGDDVADTLRLLLDERNHRTDGDLKTLAARCLHLSRGDRDLIAMRGALIEKLQQRIAKDSPKGGSDARDAARYRWLREFAVNGSIGIPFHGWLNCDEPASEWDSAIDDAMQAGDAEVQTLCDLCRKRPEAHSDAEGIGFCEVCWGEWVKANSQGAGVDHG